MSKKLILIYISLSSAWQAICILISIVFIDTLLKLIAGFTVLTIFIAVSQIVRRYQNNAGILSLHQKITPFLVFTVLAFTNLYLWASSMRMLNPPKINILYLVSGVGILIITIAFFTIAFLKQKGELAK